jgi:hypothetical protein
MKLFRCYRNPKLLPVGTGLEVERALTPAERRRILDAADSLPLVGGYPRTEIVTVVKNGHSAKATGRTVTGPSFIL